MIRKLNTKHIRSIFIGEEGESVVRQLCDHYDNIYEDLNKYIELEQAAERLKAEADRMHPYSNDRWGVIEALNKIQGAKHESKGNEQNETP